MYNSILNIITYYFSYVTISIIFINLKNIILLTIKIILLISKLKILLMCVTIF